MEIYPVIPQDLHTSASPTFAGLTINSADASDQISIYHDNTDAFIKWTGGVLKLQTDEGTNTITQVEIRPKGTEYGDLRIYDNLDAWISLLVSGGRARIEAQGGDAIGLDFQRRADLPINMFGFPTTGETQELNIFGYRDGDARRSLQIGVGVDADDSASFDGVGNLLINSSVMIGGLTLPTARLHLPAGTTTASTAPLKLTSGTDLTVPEAGVIEYDGSHFSVTEVADRRVISVASDSIATAVTVANTATETTVFTATISADELHVGKVLRIEGAGQASTHDAADTLTVRIKIGTTVLTLLAMTPGQAADDCMHFYNIITIRTTGAGGTVASHGHIQIEDSEIHENDQDVAVNTTVAEDITVTFQWNDANAGNTATLDQCFLEVLV